MEKRTTEFGKETLNVVKAVIDPLLNFLIRKRVVQNDLLAGLVTHGGECFVTGFKVHGQVLNFIPDIHKVVSSDRSFKFLNRV